ncbi:MAG TPA: GDSL-type esterase/lipase family protein [Candidatus Hydrogenedentes bacterium]|nr:GDSL-type esterase/lipase family protein [Candidatus Hydrogenedentota bacterium]HRK34798.1 GDSL-type esterase/lipase family protein [Candidatus Hydrogenedentota bacterium]
MQSRKRIAAMLGCAALLISGSAYAQLPNSIAGLGDSITRAALADNSIGGLSYGQPEHSWSTGYEAGDGVDSHYERIRAANPAINGNTYNLAESGAQMDDLPGQANAAVSSGAQYVVIQMGGNDVCADSSAEMTSVASYQTNFTTALNTLQAGLPDATILVTEVVRVKRVYDVGRLNLGCLLQWATFQWCDNVLRNGSTQRSQADARNIEYNNVLRSICAQRGLPFDDDVFEWTFSRGNLSDIDCFHPDRSGQNLLANITYSASRF